MVHIKRKKNIAALAGTFFVLILSSIATNSVFALENKYPVLPGIGGNYPTLDLEKIAKGDLIGFILYIFVFGLIISGVAAVTMFIWAGIQWTTSAGDPKKQSDARDRITKAVIGLIVLLSSYVLLNVINPDLAKLSSRGGVGAEIDCAAVISEKQTQCKTCDNMPSETDKQKTARSQCFANLSHVQLNESDVPNLKKLQAQADINAEKLKNTGVYLCTKTSCGTADRVFRVSDDIPDICPASPLPGAPCQKNSFMTVWESTVGSLHIAQNSEKSLGVTLFSGRNFGGQAKICFNSAGENDYNLYRVDYKIDNNTYWGWDGSAGIGGTIGITPHSNVYSASLLNDGLNLCPYPKITFPSIGTLADTIIIYDPNNAPIISFPLSYQSNNLQNDFNKNPDIKDKRIGSIKILKPSDAVIIYENTGFNANKTGKEICFKYPGTNSPLNNNWAQDAKSLKVVTGAQIDDGTYCDGKAGITINQ